MNFFIMGTEVLSEHTPMFLLFAACGRQSGGGSSGMTIRDTSTDAAIAVPTEGWGLSIGTVGAVIVAALTMESSLLGVGGGRINGLFLPVSRLTRLGVE